MEPIAFESHPLQPGRIVLLIRNLFLCPRPSKCHLVKYLTTQEVAIRTVWLFHRIVYRYSCYIRVLVEGLFRLQMLNCRFMTYLSQAQC